MDRNERQVIDELFGKLRQVDGKAPQRDAEAEAYIRQQVQAMPAAPYYMAQAMLVQEQALGNLQSRVQELESAAAQPAASGGFLAGAMQTALGVAGGMMIASALTSAFDGDGGEAEAATGAEDAAAFGEEPPAEEPVAEDAAFEDFGGDAGGFDEPI